MRVRREGTRRDQSVGEMLQIIIKDLRKGLAGQRTCVLEGTKTLTGLLPLDLLLIFLPTSLP